MKKILLALVASIFMLAGTAVAVPVYDGVVGGISDIQDNFNSWGLLPRYDATTSQTGVELWVPHAVGQTTTLIFQENFTGSDIFGIYNPSLTHQITLFTGASPTGSAQSVTWLDADFDGSADDVVVGGNTYFNFGGVFGYFFTHPLTVGTETVYSESWRNDLILGTLNQNETFMISFNGDGGSVNIFGTPRTFGVNDWIIAGDYYSHGIDPNTGLQLKDFDDYVVFVSEAQPVPEPATMLLLGSGLIGLAILARKRFKK